MHELSNLKLMDIDLDLKRVRIVGKGKKIRTIPISNTLLGEIVVKYLDGPSEKLVRGSIHHLAIRVKNEEELIFWEEQVRARGFQSSGIVDRFYFKSLYFRESNGLLFEIVTDGPGFMGDEPYETVGELLSTVLRAKA